MLLFSTLLHKLTRVQWTKWSVITSPEHACASGLMLGASGGQTCSMYEPHIVKPKLQRAATQKSGNTNLYAICTSVTSQFFLEQLAKVLLCGTRAATVPFYNISTLFNRNKKNKCINFRTAQRAACKGSKSRMRLASRSLAAPVIGNTTKNWSVSFLILLKTALAVQEVVSIEAQKFRAFIITFWSRVKLGGLPRS